MRIGRLLKDWMDTAVETVINIALITGTICLLLLLMMFTYRYIMQEQDCTPRTIMKEARYG